MLYVHTESKLWRRLVIQTHRRRLLGIAKKGIFAFLLPFICAAQFAIYFCNLTRDAKANETGNW